ncbi:peptidoglycan D,D-transpeptidase FtsI family protein [candidate division CSSED10-310 bacterium]|uniref:Peptidoglycan D,D-transpeptidase FtsI family protein n=1 Tax=candidate division CSSED10-310 bacterium TaxID=2855610 RepID=A0ABV6YVD8_UNCC1
MPTCLPRKTRCRLYIYFGAIFLFFAFDFATLARLQLVDHHIYLEKAQKQRKRKIRLSPKRGTIYDMNHRELALSIDVDSVFAHPHDIEDQSRVVKALSSILKLSPRKVAKTLKTERPFVWIKRHISPREKQEIEALDLKGVAFIQESKRYYPKRFLAGHILGFAGIDNQGLEGIEVTYDKKLKGSEGWYICNMDARKRKILAQRWWIKTPTSGADIVLTIDEVIQYFAEKELNKICLKERAQSGSVVVMEPETGAILAMANYPPFNPNNFGHSSRKKWRNKAVVDLFEPGSTIKALIFSAAFEEKIIQPDSRFYCKNGSITYANHTFHDWKPFQWLTAREILAFSSNVGTITIAEKLGAKKIHHYLHRFGLGSKTEIDYPGESQGILYSPQSWSKLSLPSVSIGYEMSVSALQMVNAYACIANNGTLMVPRLVREIRNTNGEIVKVNPPQIKRQVISSRTALIMKKLLHNTVLEGTGSKAHLCGYDLCGKTGTSKKFDHRSNQYSSKRVLSSFIGFGPQDHPLIVVGVFIDDPKINRWGSSAAAPVFKKIVNDIFRHWHVKPSQLTIATVQELSPDLLNKDRINLLTTAYATDKDKHSTTARMF